MGTQAAATSHEQAVHEIAQPLVTALSQELGDRLVAIVLFGSRARGNATTHSDWDLLLVATEPPIRTLQRHTIVKKLLPLPWRGLASVLAKTPEEFDAALTSLYLDIALDRIVLYDKNHYMRRRLTSLRRQLKKLGLYRVSDGREIVWHWEVAPTHDWQLEWGGAA